MKTRAVDEGHFAFGDNWLSFVSTVDARSVQSAVENLARLLPAEEFAGRRVLDIGCGSGLSLLAAGRMGARDLFGVDLDPQSVAAARTLFERWEGEARIELRSVFDLDPARDGQFDVVHSWGVLHHTGDMWRAVDYASRMVKPNGHFILALYRRTPFCPFWTAAKRFYAHAPKPAQTLIQGLYKFAFRVGLLAQRRSPAAYIGKYRSKRGMDWHHDVHDWLGGWPYQSATPDEIVLLMKQRGFAPVRSFEHSAVASGLFGTHCDEFVFIRG
jgi:2-polyprenyl-3-methyl-5-hydroxy-6-metoxy-1,4-benzoquinol methylase